MSLLTRMSRRLLWLLLILLSGCASNSAQRLFDVVPKPQQTRDPVIRVLDNGRLRLSLEVLTRDRTKNNLGVDLTSRRIRGLWLEIDNQTDSPYWLLRSSLDWDYYPVSEILYSLTGELDNDELLRLQQKLLSQSFRNPVPAHSKVSGYLFISSNHLNRVAQLVLLGKEGAWEVPVYLPVPELQGYRLPEQADLYAPEEIVSTDMDGLRKLLKELPCCTTDARSEKQGDPLNLVLVGDAADLHYAFATRNWHTVEMNYLQSAEKTINSFVFGDKYRYSPVSPLYAFGRKQDYALQKARASISQRNHLRLWLTPWKVAEKPVWIGQVSRDIGVHMTSQSPTFFTHKVDPDVDEDRNYLLEDLLLTGQVSKLGYVGGLGASSVDHPLSNLTGDSYYTDGLRVVIFLRSHKRPAFHRREHSITVLDWDHSPRADEPRHIDLSP